MLRLAVSLLASAALWICWCAYAIASFGNRDFSAHSDCAIVLGAAAYGAKPSPVFEERIRHAINLYQRGIVRAIIFTGGPGAASTHAESTVAAAYAAQAGVPWSAMHVETSSHTTHQNLVNAYSVMRANALHSAIIVSDPFHLRRAKAMADDLGIQAVTSATPTTRYRSFSTRMRFLAREVYFYHLYLLMGH